MQRLAFKMKLKPGFKDEYKRRHDALWPELQKLLAESGVRDHTAYLAESRNDRAIPTTVLS